MSVVLWLVLFAFATAAFHFSLGLALVWAALIGAVLASLGIWLVVVVLDGDGLPW